MARLLFMSGPGVSSCLLLLVALSSAAVMDRTAKRDIVETIAKAETKTTATDLAPQESKLVQSLSPKKRDIRKFDFDADFASYLGLASQNDTARYLAGDKDSTYRAPAIAVHDLPEVNLHRPLRLVPGSTPASIAFFTHIYPDKHSDGEIRVEHFSPVIHPFSSQRGKNQQQDSDDDEREEYRQPKINRYASNAPLYSPPTSSSYFGRYSNKEKYSDSPENEDPKARYQKTKHFDDDSSPDYKLGYTKIGMYHKFHEEDLYPKKTSSEWIPLKKYSKPNKDESEANLDAPMSSGDFRASSENGDEVDRIRSNINNDPPYLTNNFDLDEAGKVKTKQATFKESGHFSSEPQPEQRHKKGKRKHRRKHNRPHHHGRPAFRSAPVVEQFTKPERVSEYKPPSFEFHHPVNSYVSNPYRSPETKQKLEGEYFENKPETHEPSKGSEPFRSGHGDDVSLNAETDKDNSLEVLSDPSDKQTADVDYDPTELDVDDFDKDDLDKDYHTIREAGQREHAERTKDFDKRLPEADGKLYGSFETFDSQLDSKSKKKFEPFVQYPFEKKRQKLKTDVDELIESGKSR